MQSSPQYGANEEGIERIDISQPRYIRITDIDEHGRLSKEIGVTAKLIESKYSLQNDDLLIARSGNTVGKSYLHKSKYVNYNSFFAGYMIRFIVDSSQVLPDYVFYLTQLDYYRKWVKAIQRPTGQPNINAEEYRSLQVPVPSFEVQRKLIKKWMKHISKNNKKNSKHKTC